MFASEYSGNIMYHVWKCKTESCWKYFKNGGIKENDKGGKFN
jgi:hypothetical protein